MKYLSRTQNFPALLLSATILTLTLTAACGDSTNTDESSTNSDAASNTTGPAIVFLGDSLTAGRGLAASEAAPALIEKKLQAAGKQYRVINAGRSGDTTAGGLARLDWYLREEVQPEVLVIGLGSNDAMRGLAIDEMKKNLRTIVERARAFNPDMQIFLYQMYTFPNLGREYAGAFEKMFAEIAKETRITLLPFPLKDVAGKAELNQPDGIHPTAEGTRIMAENIWQALSRHL